MNDDETRHRDGRDDGTQGSTSGEMVALPYDETHTPHGSAEASVPGDTPSQSPGATRSYRRRSSVEEHTNLGVRVPSHLDTKLLGLVYYLRKKGIRVSKAELVALALENLPEEPTPELIRHLEERS